MFPAKLAKLTQLNFARYQLHILARVIIKSLTGATAQFNEIFRKLGFGHS